MSLSNFERALSDVERRALHISVDEADTLLEACLCQLPDGNMKLRRKIVEWRKRKPPIAHGVIGISTDSPDAPTVDASYSVSHHSGDPTN